MTRTPRLRPQALALTVLLTLGAVVGLAAPRTPDRATTQAAPAAPRLRTVADTSSAHPYSDPRWYPLQVETMLDCVRSNPGCENGHSFWGIDQIPTGQRDRPSNAQVHAMGAGIVHIKDASGDACGPNTESSFGTEVWIDHGGGIISRYGHLSRILVRAGTLVSAGQAIGVVGDTGKRSNCGRIYYTDYNVKRHGWMGDGQEISTLKACGYSGLLTYPTDVTRQAYARFNDVPARTILPAPSGAGRCLPATAPATATKATGVSFAKSGTGQLTVRWTAPSSRYRVTSVLVELSVYHPTTRRYDYMQNERFVSLSPTRTSVEFSRLIRNRPYRARVSFHNSVGWSPYGSWVVNRPS